jgi:SH3 domain protein
MRILIRNFRLAPLLGLLILLVVSAAPALAETRYVTDDLTITMRSGKGSEFRILKVLKTGTPVEVLEEDGNYLKIRTEDGEEGWVLAQYMTSETPKARVIAGLKNEVSRLKSRVEAMGADRDALKQQMNEAQRNQASEIRDAEKSAQASRQEAVRTQQELKELSGKYESLVKASGNVPGLVSERDRLSEENTRLSTVERHLKEENERIRRKVMIYWFLAGAGVFFVGWIVGKASKQRRFY